MTIGSVVAVSSPVAAGATTPPLPSSAALSFITPNLALTQAENLVTALDAAATTTTKAVTAAGGAITTSLSSSLTATLTALEAAAQQTVTDALALNTTAVGDDLTAAATNLETEIEGELAVLEGLGLSQGLNIAQQVLTPTCSLLATPTSLLGGLGIDTSRFTPLLAPITQIDAQTDALIDTTYNALYNDILGAATSALGPSGALLNLLKYDVHTVYYPPNGGAPVVRDTPALLDVPTPVDVDGSTGFDLCETLTVGTNGTIQQQISKMPLAKPLLPVDLSAELLNGTINLGTNTDDSTAPINFTTSYSSASGTTSIDNTYLVQRGVTLTLPPLLPGLKPITEQSPTPIVTQNLGIGANNAVSVALRYVNVPGSSHVKLSTSPATDLNYAGNVGADSFGYSLTSGTTVIGTNSTPAPTSLDFCYSTNSGSCSDAPAAETATDKGSLHLLASQSVLLNQYLKTATTGDGVNCTALPVLDTHVTGSTFYLGQTPGTSTASSGAIWADTGGAPLSGCVSMIGLNATLPSGFQATQRQARFHTGPLAVDSKSGTATCPTGTTIQYNLLTSLGPVLCPVPPVNSALPTITGSTFVGATLTGHNGTWTPTPNAPGFAYQWLRCDGSGANCAPISGANAISYVPPVGSPPSSSVDLGKTLRLVVTGTNADGTASATSAATNPISLPPAPQLVTPPAITGTLGSGHTLHVTDGTWNNGVANFAYQWTRCDADGVSHCAPATGAGASTNNYVVSSADEGSTLTAIVTASNIGGPASATAGPVAIPGVPTNTAPPVIQDGTSVATGASVLAGDHLKVLNGTWRDASSFNYQWQDCDPSSSVCNNIVGAASQNYVAANSDIGSTLQVIVTGLNANQAPDGSGNATAAATGAVLPNNQQLRANTVIADGPVTASAPDASGGSYIGGTFDTVGPYVGGAGAVTASTGAVAEAAQATGGKVEAVYADGSGGYFLGGAFTSVLGTPCAGLAHVTASGTLDPTYCLAGLTGDVRAMDRIGTLLAVGGSFSVGSHQNLIFVSPDGSFTGVVGGDPDGAVNAIADDGPSTSSFPNPSFYVGGDFTHLAGAAFSHLAKVQPSGTTVTPVGWPASVTCTSTCTTPTINSLTEVTFTSGSLYVPYMLAGGQFDNAVGGASPQTPTARHDAAAFGTGANAAVGGWNPNPDGVVRSIAVPVTNLATATPPSAVYLGGDFTHIGAGTNTIAVSHLGEFAINSLEGNGTTNAGATATSSPSTVWTPSANNTVSAITVLGGNVYVGGSFTTINGTSRHRIAAVGPSGTAAPALLSFNPNAGQPVLTLAHDTTNVYTGGQFAVLGGTTRLNIAEINPSSGVSSWNPSADGTVNAIAVTSSGVWLGGSFSHAGGATRNGLALVDPSSGNPLGSDAGITGTVRALAADGAGGVYAGGTFTSSGPANLADVNSAGTINSWGSGADGTVNAISIAGGVVYVGGSFANAGGALRPNLAGLSAATGNATGWSPVVDGTVNAIAANGSFVYIGGAFSNAGGVARSSLAALDPTTGNATAWNPGTDGTVSTLATLGNTVYVGGSFSQADGANLTNLAALDGSDGTPTSFQPNPDRPVATISAGPTGLLTVGGSFSGIAGATSPNLAFFGG